jgi:hypothetical protein
MDFMRLWRRIRFGDECWARGTGSLLTQRRPATTFAPSLQQRGEISRRRACRSECARGRGGITFREFASQAAKKLNSKERHKQASKQRELQSVVLKCTTAQEVLATMQQAMDRDARLLNHVHVATALHRVAKFSKRSRGLGLDRDPTFIK